MTAKLFIILVLGVCAFAAEEERVKKDVLLGTIPYAYSALPYSYAATYDDGKYYPGKYEKTILAAPAFTSPYHAPAFTSPYHAPAFTSPYHGSVAHVAPVATVSAYSAHSVHPLPYANYPYHYGSYPFLKSYVY